jgi:hypothetical protein
MPALFKRGTPKSMMDKDLDAKFRIITELISVPQRCLDHGAMGKPLGALSPVDVALRAAPLSATETHTAIQSLPHGEPDMCKT